MVTRIFQIVLTLSLMLSAGMLRAALNASVNSTDITDGDAITLTVTLSNEDANGELDLAPLAKNFTVLGQKQSRNVSIINGRRTEETSWIISVLPKTASSALIPPLSVGSKKTQAIAITIKPAPKNQTLPAPDSVLISSQVDRDQVYVGGQILLTISITHRGNLAGASLSEPNIDGASVQQIHEASFQRQINNTAVIVIERRYAIVPEKPGELTIAPQLLQAELNIGGQRGLFGLSNSQTVHRRSQAITIKSLPIPDYALSKDAITADNLQLQQQWSGDLSQLKVGDSITRTLTISADGAPSAQLPPIWSRDIDGMKQYRDQPKLDDTISATGIIGVRKESIAYVLTSAGNFELPAISLHWLDATSGKVKSVSLPSVQIRVAAAPASAMLPPTNLNNNTELDQAIPTSGATHQIMVATPFYRDVWFWLSVAFAGIWLATIIIYRGRNTPKIAPKPSVGSTDQHQHFKSLLKACKRNDAASALPLFNRWGRQFGDKLTTNADICALLNNPEITKSIQRAEKALYAKNSAADAPAAWSGTHLASHLEAVNKQWLKASNQTDLAPLYS